MAPYCSDIENTDLLLRHLEQHRRVLLWGEMGIGKSTLALELLKATSPTRPGSQILELDPGSPSFGIPGTVCRGRWSGKNGLRWVDCQALCSLNGGRFRLPLIQLAHRLMKKGEKDPQPGPYIIDPPGVVRGVGGAELLTALCETLNIDLVVVLRRRESSPAPLHHELASLHAETLYVTASSSAKRPSKLVRIKDRTRLWNTFLCQSRETEIVLDDISLLGTPPPPEIPEAWKGRQAALLDEGGETIGIGEISEFLEGKLTVHSVAVLNKKPAALLIRDAGRDTNGCLATIPHIGGPVPIRREPVEMTPPVLSPQAGYQPVSSHLGPAWATLVGGVLGDPLLHVRFRERKNSLFFDLGDPGRLSAKVAHQVSAVFLSHTHLDHIGGFIWFLRSRIGHFGPCRIFGPPGTIVRITSLIEGITWDRIKDKGPLFETCDIAGSSLYRTTLQPGKSPITHPVQTIDDGVLLSDDDFTIRAVACDHNIPSMAYSLVLGDQIKVKKEHLVKNGYTPGPWLGRLNHCIATNSLDAVITLPSGEQQKAETLANLLTELRPGKKLVYAADMADTAENRKKLIDLADSAHTFFCETAFTLEDKNKADASQHLTTLAAVEIAREAGVERLAPFHFSKRYQHSHRSIYEEVLADAGPLEILGNFR